LKYEWQLTETTILYDIPTILSLLRTLLAYFMALYNLLTWRYFVNRKVELLNQFSYIILILLLQKAFIKPCEHIYSP